MPVEPQAAPRRPGTNRHMWLSNVPYLPGSTGTPWAGADYPFAATQNERFSYAVVSRTGIYTILLLNHHGDTRGRPWYSDLICQAEKPYGGQPFAHAMFRARMPGGA